jgi:hypothetical protein
MRLPAMAGTLSAAALVAATLLPGIADAGAIRGTLFLSARAQKSVGESAEPRLQRGVEDAIVYVDSIPEKVERDLTSRRFLFIRLKSRQRVLNVVQRQRFDPRVAVVAVGTQVAFINLDRIYHSLFSVSPAHRFDLGKHAPGERDTLLFERPGVVNLHCDIHPDETGYLVVTPNHAYARPDSLGRYRLPRLPPGDYTVRVFHPRWGEFARDATVPKRGDLTLDLVK